jgi:hypothetical protein
MLDCVAIAGELTAERGDGTTEGRGGYQTLINEALKQAIVQENLESTLRRVLREERAAYEVKRRR